MINIDLDDSFAFVERVELQGDTLMVDWRAGGPGDRIPLRGSDCP